MVRAFERATHRLSMAEVEKLSGLSRNTVRRHVWTLVQRGEVEHELEMRQVFAGFCGEHLRWVDVFSLVGEMHQDPEIDAEVKLEAAEGRAFDKAAGVRPGWHRGPMLRVEVSDAD